MVIEEKLKSLIKNLESIKKEAQSNSEYVK